MAFWGSDLSADNVDPKRKFRWKVAFGGSTPGVGGNDLQVGGPGGILWFAKTCTKPEVTVGDVEHKFIGHTFKFPGSVTWNDIEVTLVDPASPDASKQTLDLLHGAGYRTPDTAEEALNTMGKGAATAALGTFIIFQLDSNGNTIEKWELHNPFITKVGFGDLDYGSDDLSEISLTIKYDWAKWRPSDADTDDIFTKEYTAGPSEVAGENSQARPVPT